MLNYSKPVIIIPAWNEEDNIGRTIDLIKATGLDVHIIVVNDGSTDKTSEVVKSKEVELIDLPRNYGKAGAFFAGIRNVLPRLPISVAILDADLLDVPKESLKELIELPQKDTLSRNPKMYVPKHYLESTGICPLAFIGIRSFSIPFLYLVMRSRIKSWAKGYSLELFLDYFYEYNRAFVEREYIENVPFKGLEEFRRGTPQVDVRDKKQFDETGYFVNKRKKLEDKLKRQRVYRNLRV